MSDALTALLATQRGLVNQHASVRQCQTLAGVPAASRTAAAEAAWPRHNGLDLGTDELHGVVDGGHCGEGATGRVNVQGDVTLGSCASSTSS